MRLALLTTFAASKKEPLVAMMNRVHQAFLDAGLGKPTIQFTFGDPMVPGFVSSVDRVLKRYPELKRFVTDAAPAPGIPGVPRISNGPASQAAGESIPYETLQAIAAGVPRSFPFHSVVLYFAADEFGPLGPVTPTSAGLLPGVLLSDSWWVNGRIRSLSLGVGFKATLLLPVAARAGIGAQYPIGDAEQWAKIVDNLAGLVKELDRTFVPDIERAAGPSPEWYRPSSAS